MVEFAVNVQRVDPYKNFKFRVMLDGQYIPGVVKVTPLRRTTEVILQRKGSEVSMERKSPGITRYESIVIERGLTHDKTFESWAEKVWNINNGAGAETSQDFRKDVIIELFNEAGQLAMRYKVYRCWPSEYQALPTLDSEGYTTAIESITLENEGFVRDASLAEPKEPTF